MGSLTQPETTVTNGRANLGGWNRKDRAYECVNAIGKRIGTATTRKSAMDLVVQASKARQPTLH
jgi:hypothetical protein